MNLSVIVPAYNVERYIEAALDSVFAQDKRPYEVIVVNDGSTDFTEEKIKNYRHIPELKVVITKNQGLGPARNEGLRHASGEYVYFFDSDDVLDRKFVATIDRVVKASDGADLILFSGESFQDDDDSVERRDLMRPFTAHGLNGDEAVAHLVRAGSPITTAWLYVSKRNLWIENELSFKPIIHEDDEMFLRVLLVSRAVVILQNVLMYQRIRPGSIMTSRKTRHHAHGLLVTAGTVASLYAEATGRPVKTRKAIRKRAIRTAQRYLRVCRKTGCQCDTQCMWKIAWETKSFPLIFSHLYLHVRALMSKRGKK